MRRMNVAFLGLGTMGAPMAANILKRGHALAVWNRSPARAESLVTAGARLASSPADAARGAEFVLTMLSDVRAVDEVYEQLAPALEKNSVAIDLSTVDPATARRTDERVRARGAEFLDAPVSGTRKPAVDGTLLILAAGPAATVERARPILEHLGRVRHVGDVGQGMAMKLVLNGLGAHMITGLSAMLTFGARHGLDGRAMLDVIASGAFSSPLYASKGERILARDFRPDFTLALTLKDQELVLGAARDLGVPLPTLSAVRDVLADAVATGLAVDDLCGLVQWFERASGVTVTEKAREK